MITIEQVEKLRQYANVSYGEAKAALESSGGNILDAVVLLEKEGKTAEPEHEGAFQYEKKSAETGNKANNAGSEKSEESAAEGTSLFQLLGRFFRWCGKVIHRANLNTLDVTNNKKHTVLRVPSTILILLLIFAFPITITLIILGLICGYRYTFNGPDLGTEPVNRFMGQVADTAGNIKDEIRQGFEGDDKDVK